MSAVEILYKSDHSNAAYYGLRGCGNFWVWKSIWKLKRIVLTQYSSDAVYYKEYGGFLIKILSRSYLN